MKRFTLGGEEIDPELEQESIKMANVLMLLSRGDGCGEDGEASVKLPLSRVFECKTCNRRFSSFQALGGHRTSHKKPIILPDSQKSLEGLATKPKVHACSICGLEFPIGQALGGHMRRHRTMAPSLASGAVKQKPEGRRTMCFDLNLLPFENEIESSKIVSRTEIVDQIPVVECFH